VCDTKERIALRAIHGVVLSLSWSSHGSRGTTIYMPPDALVSFANGPHRLVALQVFAGPEPAAKYDAWTPVAR